MYIPKGKDLSLLFPQLDPTAGLLSLSLPQARTPSPSQPGSIPAMRTPRQHHASPSQPRRIPSLTPPSRVAAADSRVRLRAVPLTAGPHPTALLFPNLWRNPRLNPD